MAEDPLSQAQRHVREGEQRVAEQIDRLARMKADGDSERGIASAEVTLELLQRSLDLARERLALVRATSWRLARATADVPGSPAGEAVSHCDGVLDAQSGVAVRWAAKTEPRR